MRRRTGFTYLGLLFFVAITSAAMASLGQMWSVTAQREREAELMFRGEEIGRAIRSYLDASPTKPPQRPRTLDDLLSDSRSGKTKHHLRRRYADPFTGEFDWVLISSIDGQLGFEAVRSRSDHKLLREHSDSGASIARASDFVFGVGESNAGRLIERATKQ